MALNQDEPAECYKVTHNYFGEGVRIFLLCFAMLTLAIVTIPYRLMRKLR